MKTYRYLLLVSILMAACCACAPNLQREIDDQGKAITLLQQKTQELDRSLRRLQADYHSEMDKMSVELQAIKGSINENTRRNEQALTEVNQRLSGQPGPAAESPEQDQLESRPPGDEGSGSVPQPVLRKPPAAPAPLTDKELYTQAYNLYAGGDYEKSRKLFQEFFKLHPGSGLVDNALYWIASCYYKEKKFEEAISACDDAIKKFPKGKKTPDAYYLQALSFCEIKDPLTAQILLETLTQNFPDTEAARLGKKKYDELKAGAAE
jgi:tol-pal system protein YbgF